MIRPLKKGSFGVPITYYNGGFSNNLIGKNFAVDVNDGNIKMNIDLSSNLRKRNQDINCVPDANELAKNHALIKFLEIHDDKIITGLIEINKMNPDSIWKLEINLGDKGFFDYTISISFENGRVVFEIQGKV